MGFFVWLFAILGGFSALIGIGSGLAFIPDFYGLDWTFWFALGAILLLVSIVFSLNQRGEGD
ncbi:MAG: hypothetical protein V1894_06600 [Chloroflexota bacterium]